jgi:hypothetical protein
MIVCEYGQRGSVRDIRGAFRFTGELDGLKQWVTGNSQAQKIQVAVLCWAESRVSTNTHTGMSYVWYGVMTPTFSFSFLTLFLIFMTHDDSRRTRRP